VTVILADSTYRVRKRAHPFAEDAHGTPVAGVLGDPGPARPGAMVRQADGMYSGRLDPAEWPVRAGDVAVDAAGRTFVLTGVPRLHANTAAADVDYVGADATLDPPETP
jgi:hypothetical protein